MQAARWIPTDGSHPLDGRVPAFFCTLPDPRGGAPLRRPHVDCPLPFSVRPSSVCSARPPDCIVSPSFAKNCIPPFSVCHPFFCVTPIPDKAPHPWIPPAPRISPGHSVPAVLSIPPRARAQLDRCIPRDRSTRACSRTRPRPCTHPDVFPRPVPHTPAVPVLLGKKHSFQRSPRLPSFFVFPTMPVPP
jgi:hypothetical protein